MMPPTNGWYRLYLLKLSCATKQLAICTTTSTKMEPRAGFDRGCAYEEPLSRMSHRGPYRGTVGFRVFKGGLAALPLIYL
jgi:hypothetical protein